MLTIDECLRFLNELIDEVDLSLRMPGHHKHENARLMQRRANLVAVKEALVDHDNDICKCGDRRREHDANGCRVCREHAHMQGFPVCRGFRPEGAELSYPGRPDHVVLHTESCAAHPRWSAGPCNCGAIGSDPVAALHAMREALKHSERALASLPVDALGMGHDDNHEWPLRDELLTRVRAALKLWEAK